MQNLNHLVSLLQEGYKTIKVSFVERPARSLEDFNPIDLMPWQQQEAARQGQQATGQRYTYKCHFECQVGDLVILPPASDSKLPSIGTVVQVDDEPDLNFESGIEYKWAIAKVDTSAYADIMRREKELIKMLREQEKKTQRKRLLESYQLSLPDDEDSRKIFDQARQIGLTSKD